MRLTADFSVIDPQRMMCTYGLTEGFLLNHSSMPGMSGSISSQHAVRAPIPLALQESLAHLSLDSPIAYTLHRVHMYTI